MRINGSVIGSVVTSSASSAVGIWDLRNVELANRQIIWPSAGSIITSGLILNLDAGNVASYPGTGTTWTDLSGNSYNATLTNGPTFTSLFGGNIVFDGTNDYAVSTVTGGLGSGNFTLEFWYYKITDAGMIFNSRSGGTGSDGIDISRTLGITTSGTVIFSATSVSNSTWTNVFIGRSSGTMYRYINSTLIDSTSMANSFTSTTFYIGGNIGGNVGYLNGYMPIVRLYNKFLSSDERSTNYNFNRTRFGV
jgi:hypothetical protein